MVRHEEGCTANPNRICRLHKWVIGEKNPVIPSITQLLAVIEVHRNDVDHGLKELREAADDCPTCILAALRQSGLTNPVICAWENEGHSVTYRDKPLVSSDEFDFKKELDAVWSQVNADIREQSSTRY